MFDFSPYTAVLLDLDGTIYHEHTVLPGAVELVAHLRSLKHRFACLTNSNDSPMQVEKRLSAMGIDIPASHVYTATAAAADYVRAHLISNGKPRVFNLASEGLAELLQGDVHWTTPDEKSCDAVLSGAPSSSFATVDRQWLALQYLRSGANLIAMCADRIFPSPRGAEFGSGALAHMLSYAANVKTVYCGKPEPIFFNALASRLGVRTADCILIGDNLESDIAGARAVGMPTILTLTGVTRKSDLHSLSVEKTPDKIITDLTELL